MSSVTFFPTTWFVDASWTGMQTVGYLDNNKSVYLWFDLEPYFTVKYDDNTDLESIEEGHTFLTSSTPVKLVEFLTERIYRIVTTDLESYNNALSFVKRNVEGEILDEDQDIKSKWVSRFRVTPGLWQTAYNLKTLPFNIIEKRSYTTCDLEYLAESITSVNHTAPIPNKKVYLYDIESIPHDDLTFPDPTQENPPDMIFCISTVALNVLTIFILTGTALPSKYITDPARSVQPYEVNVVSCSSEKEVLERFFAQLHDIKPDVLVTFNGRSFDNNYIGVRAELLGVRIPNFSKIIDGVTEFKIGRIVQRKPFPLDEERKILYVPGVLQVDLLNFYRRMFPYLGNHKLDTIGELVLGKGKTGLSIKELFSRYRSGTQEDMNVIIDYSIVDSILLYELWQVSDIFLSLSNMSSFWKNDIEEVLYNDERKAFINLIHYVAPDIGKRPYWPGKAPLAERETGVYKDVHLYSISNLYIEALANSTDPLANYFAKYFTGRSDGIVPFSSGYFKVNFSQIQRRLPTNNVVWIDEDTVATTSHQNGLTLMAIFPLVIVKDKSWIAVTDTGRMFKKGMGELVRPSFGLLRKEIDKRIALLAGLTPPQDEDITLNDYELEIKITDKDFIKPSNNNKADIVDQLKSLGQRVDTSWRRVKYIRTKNGPIIEDIYSNDPEKYSQILDLKWYQDKLNKTLKIFQD